MKRQLGGAARRAVTHNKGEECRLKDSRRGSQPRLGNPRLPLPMANTPHRRLGGASQQRHSSVRSSRLNTSACSMVLDAAAAVMVLPADICRAVPARC